MESSPIPLSRFLMVVITGEENVKNKGYRESRPLWRQKERGSTTFNPQKLLKAPGRTAGAYPAVGIPPGSDRQLPDRLISQLGDRDPPGLEEPCRHEPPVAAGA